LNKRLAEAEEGILAPTDRLRVGELLADVLDFYQCHRPKNYADFAILTVKHLQEYWSEHRVRSVTTDRLHR